ncbi:WhiB family transcriptional regulator [Streptomyces sp. MC1]|uniref:WhiB family transcriptional regulator n=1 Tax=Streptomyces sp. MC1 TaxID=295105 RepID=UPI0018CABD04|nr:WhiB family transcriptional regulator [Streptomyces sp. MC1]MBG7704899.1 WhiB family transcriptional regulator [Streptomyces sp. MC1]
MSSAPDFMRDAPCARVNPEVMFPAPADHKGLDEAKQVCAPCEFREQCLSYALSPDTRIADGVAGGKSERERQRMRKPKVRPYRIGPLPPKSKRHAPAA